MQIVRKKMIMLVLPLSIEKLSLILMSAQISNAQP